MNIITIVAAIQPLLEGNSNFSSTFMPFLVTTPVASVWYSLFFAVFGGRRASEFKFNFTPRPPLYQLPTVPPHMWGNIF